MHSTQLPTIFQPSTGEAESARDLRAKILSQGSNGPSEIKIVVDGRSMEGTTLPLSVVNILMEGLMEIGKGNAVRVVSHRAEVSMDEASELLNLSRSFVARLLDEGKLPYHKVDSQRRIRFDDVMEYKRLSDSSRRQALQNLVDEAQELGMGY